MPNYMTQVAVKEPWFPIMAPSPLRPHGQMSVNADLATLGLAQSCIKLKKLNSSSIYAFD